MTIDVKKAEQICWNKFILISTLVSSIFLYLFQIKYMNKMKNKKYHNPVEKSIPLTHKYVTAYFPVLLQALQ
jgi:hypothetical protein